tara:strand:+ start:536 stop:871 length:336 start_codon:yes stop_codon:yes gene_type:complete
MSDDIHNQLYRKDIGTEISLSGDDCTIRACRVWCNSNLEKTVGWVPHEDGNSLYIMTRDGVEINYCFLNDKDAKLFERYIESDKFKRDIKSLNNAQGSWINSNAKSIPVIK